MLARLVQNLSAQPDLVEDMLIDSREVPLDAGKLFTRERLEIIDLADADISAGNGLTLDQLDARLAQNRAIWLAANPF